MPCNIASAISSLFLEAMYFSVCFGVKYFSTNSLEAFLFSLYTPVLISKYFRTDSGAIICDLSQKKHRRAQAIIFILDCICLSIRITSAPRNIFECSTNMRAM
jgi:hypothetical protein